MTGATTGQYGN